MLNNKSYALARLDLTGTPFEIGLQLGRFGAAAVHDYLLGSPAWATVQQWKDSAAARQMSRLTRERLPDIWTELEGLAQGLELPLDDVFLWNARGDLWAMAPDGCTSVLIPGDGVQRITHNEDGDPGFAGHCAIAQCTVSGKPGFASFVYPGSLPGHTLAVNNLGVAMTVNNVRALYVDPGLPRMVLARAILDLSDVASALRLLQTSPRAGAFNLNLADTVSQTLVSVEYSSAMYSVKKVSQPMLHANHAIHPATRDYPQIITGSSGHRQLRGDTLITQPSVDPLLVLADNDGGRFPIFRRSLSDTDNENTLATADLTIYPDRVDWYVYEDPRQEAAFQLANGRFVSGVQSRARIS